MNEVIGLGVGTKAELGATKEKIHLAVTALEAVPHSDLLAPAARVSILILSGAIALSQMGLASEIIQLAFAVLLAAIALGAALAFGLGGRELAAREFEEWLKSVRSKKSAKMLEHPGLRRIVF